VASYRLYILNGQGHIVDAVAFLCDDDEEALGIARELNPGPMTELWCGARIVPGHASAAPGAADRSSAG